MKLLSVLLVSLSTVFGSPAHADLDCDFIQSIDLMHNAMLRTIRDDLAPLTRDEHAMLELELRSLQQADLDLVLGDGYTSSKHRVFESFIGQSETMLNVLDRSGADAARRVLATQQTRLTLRQLSVILHSLGCNVDRPNPENEDPVDGETSTLQSILFHRGLNFVVIALVGLATGLAVWFGRRKAKTNRRRKKRYPVSYATEYRVGTAKFKGVLLDISCHGVKLSHDPAHSIENGTVSDVYVTDQWRSVRPAWSNAHYSGATFTKPLRSFEVKQVRRSKKSR